jgi:hypothetical protein
MTKSEIELIFNTDIDSPASYKSGEYLYSLLAFHTKQALLDSRKELIEVLTDWLRNY